MAQYDPIQLLRDDHKQILGFLRQLENNPDIEAKEVLDEIDTLFGLHSELQEKALFPRLLSSPLSAGDVDIRGQIEACLEEHDQIHELIKQLHDYDSKSEEFHAILPQLIEAFENDRDREEAEIYSKAASLIVPVESDQLANQIIEHQTRLRNRSRPGGEQLRKAV
jgi:hypothetical protein